MREWIVLESGEALNKVKYVFCLIADRKPQIFLKYVALKYAVLS